MELLASTTPRGEPDRIFFEKNALHDGKIPDKDFSFQWVKRVLPSHFFPILS